MDVLIEARSKDNPEFWQGYTDNYLKVLFKSNLNLKTQLIPLRLKKIVKDSVLADLDCM
jgi:tRNA A37 methylthiotransferase MiaB